MAKSRCVVLIQLGTPDSLKESSIQHYLDEFLMDPGTIAIPYWLRYMLVKWIIVPKRSKKVIDRYKQIWDSQKGSPLAYHSVALEQKLKGLDHMQTEFRLGMLYGSPKVENILESILQEGFQNLVMIPLFPHYTPATTAVAERRVNAFLKMKDKSVQCSWIPPFFAHPSFISLLANRVKQQDVQGFDHIIFSYHGLPMKQIGYDKKMSGTSNYVEACELTTRLLAKQLALNESKYSISYQSRFGRNWTSPQTEDLLEVYAKEGKSIMIVSPSFTADCLETSWEIGVSFKEKFYGFGGTKFTWVESLNSDDDWVNTIFELIEEK